VPAEQTKSDLYRDVLPLLNSRSVDLLDDRRLVAQLCGLERRTARGGRDSIDHGPGAHDDLANAAPGALVLAIRQPASLGLDGGLRRTAKAPEEWAELERKHLRELWHGDPGWT